MTSRETDRHPERDATFPAGWQWSGPATARHTDHEAGILRLEAPAGADLFVMPGVREVDRLPALTRPVTHDFRLEALVDVEGGTRFDAGGILVDTGNGSLKLCVERAVSGGWSVVTIVTRPTSDEAAGPSLVGPAAGLLVTRQGERLATFFREPDEPDWRFARTLTVPATELRVGVFAQAPLSDGCTAVFRDVKTSPTPLRDRR
ncbi:DUF1349 domain-containing protein [Streptomyces scopuliridis]|uniref:DUF1349 domain-containing protein n=1 Tax=Streptomyces scopuliridis TaxID=452529 RepID=UPI0035DCDF8D